jgi:hypothetical protein
MASRRDKVRDSPGEKVPSSKSRAFSRFLIAIRTTRSSIPGFNFSFKPRVISVIVVVPSQASQTAAAV